MTWCMDLIEYLIKYSKLNGARDNPEILIKLVPRILFTGPMGKMKLCMVQTSLQERNWKQ